MRPSRVIGHEERRLGRPLTEAELEVILTARGDCHDGKRATVKAMRAALAEHLRASATSRERNRQT